ncbi:MAG: surface lipoprotein assembly modifier [Roseinatronobacter sp.]
MLLPGTGAAENVGPATVEPQQAEIRMHWQMAQTHLSERAPRAALPHLERLVTLSPQTARFRLELGRALYLIEEDDRARHHFQFALGGELSLREISTVNEYLRAMDSRKPWQGHARVALVRHSNPFHRSGDDFVSIGGLLLLPLPPVESANGAEIALGGTYLPRIAQDLHARLHLVATGQFFENQDLNRWHLRGELGLLSIGDQAQQISGGVALQGAFDKQGEIMRGIGVYVGAQRRFGNRTLLSFRATADKLSYARAPSLDGPRYTARLDASHILSPRTMLQAGLSLSHHHAQSGFNRRSTGSLSFGGRYAFSGGVQAGLETEISKTRVAEPNPLLFQHGPERSTRLGVTARLMHRDYTVKGFAPVLILGYETQTSNLPTRNFDDFKFSIGATRNF